VERREKKGACREYAESAARRAMLLYEDEVFDTPSRGYSVPLCGQAAGLLSSCSELAIDQCEWTNEGEETTANSHQERAVCLVFPH
jgi:hypothetical protein